MSKLILIISAIIALCGTTVYVINSEDLLELEASTEFSINQKETAFSIAADSLEETYNKMINEESLYERNCN